MLIASGTMVLLILAAQYERLTLAFAVILAVPFAVFGAFVAVWARGLYNDLYLQIGLVTLAGLAAKNAILIVEFAAHMHREGMELREAAIEAARREHLALLFSLRLSEPIWGVAGAQRTGLAR